MKTFLFIIGACLLTALQLFGQNVIKPLGGYIQIEKEPGYLIKSDFNIIIYFSIDSPIPDSIYLTPGVTILKSGQSIVCNKIIKQNYTLQNYDFGGTSSRGYFDVNSYFKNINTKFKGNNGDTIGIGNKAQFSLLARINFEYGMSGYDNYSSIFKDFPLIEVEKNKTINFNLFDHELDGDSIHFEFGDNLNNSPKTPNGALLNSITGDIFIDAKDLDTGYYSILFNSMEFNDNYIKSESWYVFTINVVNKHISYFTNNIIYKKDSSNIPYIMAKISDKTVNYQADFINPKGLGNYSIDVPATKPLNKPPTVKTTQINDTLLHINIDVNLDPGFYPVYKDLPTSLSIIVTTTDSTGNCKQDLTSFYVTNNHTNSIDEVTTKNKISISPNPATIKLTINSETVIKEIYIYDLLGNLVKQMNVETTHSKDTEIVIDELKSGIYIIQVIDVFDAKLSSKFIKE